jgi:uncharacterized protein YcbX
MIEITQLNIFPVKSLQGITVDSATVSIRGVEFDRHWMVIDASGRFVSQRELPAMATIRVTLLPDALVLEHPSIAALELALGAARPAPVPVQIWNHTCPAHEEGAAASHWLTAVLGPWRGGALRLVRFAQQHHRRVDPQYLRGEASHIAFSDGFPFLVTAEASLASLNEQLAAGGAAAVPMDRFRPNIVLRGLAPFQEDSLEGLAATRGTYAFGLRKPCRRCAIITTDQGTGRIPDAKEPLRTLMRMNPRADMPGAFFGQNAILLAGERARISVGDQLEIQHAYA